MRKPRLRLALSLGVGLVLSLLAASLALRWQNANFSLNLFTGDYAVDGDKALLHGWHGHLFSMYAGRGQKPLMFPIALLLRLPAVAIVQGWHISTGSLKLIIPWVPAHGDRIWTRYIYGALACMAAVFGATLCAIGRQRGRWAKLNMLIPGATLLCSGLAGMTLEWGHVEELLGTGLLLAALLAAQRQRWLWATVLIAASAATKQPYVLALPAFALAVPKGQRRRLYAIGTGLLVLFTLPWMADGLFAVIGKNSSVVSNTPGTSYTANLFATLGLAKYGNLGHPLVLLLAVAIPVLIARREGWQLSALRMEASLGIIYVLRTVLDPLNISYYQVPLLACLIALEWRWWENGGHPLARLGIKLRLLPIAIAVDYLYVQAYDGSIHLYFQRHLGETYGAAFCTLGALVILMLAPLAFEGQIRTSDRRRLAGWISAVVALPLTFVLVGTFGKPQKTIPLAPPPGMAISTVSNIAKRYPNAFWLGQSLPDNPLRLSARVVAHPNDKIINQIGQEAFFDYGQGDGLNGVSVFISKAPRSVSFDRRVLRCREGHCGRYSIISTAVGPGLTDKVGSYWEIQVIKNKSLVYIIGNIFTPQLIGESIVQLPMR